MVIKNLINKDIKKNIDQNSKFTSIDSDKLKISCQIFKGIFYLDTIHYFLITSNDYSFSGLYGWNRETADNKHHFLTNEFYSNFVNNKKNFKIISDVTVLGSSLVNNYHRNLISFLPRIFFIKDQKINLAIHRNSTNKFRKLISDILRMRGVIINKFIYLDSGFYCFKNSQIPQFFTIRNSVKILNQLSKKNLYKNKIRIYLTRKNASFRKLINEAELIDELKFNNFIIIDTDTLTIEKQIEIFSSAEIVIGPTGSALANIVFCQKGTKVVEIMPNYNLPYEERYYKQRYFQICKLLGLKYFSFLANSVQVEKIDVKKKKFIDSSVIENSNYYKNLLVKERDFKRFINQI